MDLGEEFFTKKKKKERSILNFVRMGVVACIGRGSEGKFVLCICYQTVHVQSFTSTGDRVKHVSQHRIMKLLAGFAFDSQPQTSMRKMTSAPVFRYHATDAFPCIYYQTVHVQSFTSTGDRVKHVSQHCIMKLLAGFAFDSQPQTSTRKVTSAPVFRYHAPDAFCVFAVQILSCVIDPLLQMCSMSASRLNTVDMAAYMINCIYLIQSTLALYQFTDTRLEMLQAQVMTGAMHILLHVPPCLSSCSTCSLAPVWRCCKFR